VPLPAGLKNASRLPQPIFTPGIRIYQEAADFALTKGLIIADTKFEFGLDPQGKLVLMDEVLTPDSSRYWPVEGYQAAFAAGQNPPSYDKQFVRDWLEAVRIDGHPWDKTPPAPRLPQDVIARTAAKYREALQRLTA
jgi:phosphoribosylaminoimidazole-succinocarboxamide synthase